MVLQLKTKQNLKSSNFSVKPFSRWSLIDKVRSERRSSFMTRNQIEFQKTEELRRANIAQEGLTSARDAETARANRATESWRTAQLAETQRTNQANEDLKAQQNAETHRSNLVHESYNWAALGEQNRSNLAKELLTMQQNVETSRHNASVESETERSNRSNEDIGRERNSVSKFGAVLSAQTQKDINDAKLAQERAINTYNQQQQNKRTFWTNVTGVGQSIIRTIGRVK